MEALCEKFSSRVKKPSTRVWSVKTPQFAEWPKLMQFKAKKRVVDSQKSEQSWNQSLVAMRGCTVTLMVYEYGMTIATAQDRDDFTKASILPGETDRAGATAECSLRDVVEALRQKCGTTFQALHFRVLPLCGCLDALKCSGSLIDLDPVADRALRLVENVCKVPS